LGGHRPPKHPQFSLELRNSNLLYWFSRIKWIDRESFFPAYREGGACDRWDRQTAGLSPLPGGFEKLKPGSMVFVFEFRERRV